MGIYMHTQKNCSPIYLRFVEIFSLNIIPPSINEGSSNSHLATKKPGLL